MTPNTEPSAAPAAQPARKKPRIALAIATAFGVGYIPRAPGTFGSLVGLLLAWGSWFFWGIPCLLLFLLVAAVGVWSGGRVAAFAGIRDPRYVVMDEISGQHLTYLLGFAPAWRSITATHSFIAGLALSTFPPVSWKYLLLGFILFRVFDIWKPFPVRQAERLPGGWGIMADDWVAAVYAALGLWIARYLGL